MQGHGIAQALPEYLAGDPVGVAERQIEHDESLVLENECSRRLHLVLPLVGGSGGVHR
jgi:hypothetical protein